MKKWLTLSLACAASYSMANNDISVQIVNGNDASVTTYPSIVSLIIDQIEFDGRYSVAPYCGATLLDAQHILTAAHCFYSDRRSQLFTVVVPQLQNKSDFPDRIAEKMRVVELYYPSTYNDDTLRDDIAILKLESSLTSVQATDYLTLPVAGQDFTYRSDSETFIAVGHGNARSGVSSSDSLQQANLSYVLNNECNYSVTTEQNLCMEGAISFVTGLENATCQGDSGGPLYWFNGATQVQVGLTSFGPNTQCGDPDLGIGATSVFTEIHDYRNWIQRVLSGIEQPKIVVDDFDREAFLSGVSMTSSSDSGGGGGSLGTSIIVLSLLWIRRSLMKT
nr:serine protease [Vibrio maerlii]